MSQQDSQYQLAPSSPRNTKRFWAIMTIGSLILLSVFAGLPDDFPNIGSIPRRHGGTEAPSPSAIVHPTRFTLSPTSILNIITVTPFGNYTVPATTTADYLHVASACLRSDVSIAPHFHRIPYPDIVQHLFPTPPKNLALTVSALDQLACDLEQQWRRTGRVPLTTETPFGSGSEKAHTYAARTCRRH